MEETKQWESNKQVVNKWRTTQNCQQQSSEQTNSEQQTLIIDTQRSNPQPSEEHTIMWAIKMPNTQVRGKF